MVFSPDEEMVRLEDELIRRAREKPSIPINPAVTLHRNIDLGQVDCGTYSNPA